MNQPLLAPAPAGKPKATPLLEQVRAVIRVAQKQGGEAALGDFTEALRLSAGGLALGARRSEKVVTP